MSLANSGDQSDEQREYLLEAQFDQMANELSRELSLVEASNETPKQIDACGRSVQEILWTVRFLHRIFARSRTNRFYLERQISESELLRMATRGYPLKLRQAEAEVKNIRDQIPESPTLIQVMAWSGFRWTDLVMKMGFEHHRILEDHSDRKIHQWWPFIEEVAGRGDGSCAKWNYDIQGDNVGQLRRSFASLPKCEWISIEDTWLPISCEQQASVVHNKTQGHHTTASVKKAVKFLLDLISSAALSHSPVQRRTVELLIEYDGRLPIRDLAKESDIDWGVGEHDNAASSLLKRLKQHFAPPFAVRRDCSDIVVTIDGKPVRK